MSELKVNSKEYWDYRFSEDWEVLQGREQTSFFINLLLNSLPKELIIDMEENRIEVCDAGCAEGEGTYLFANRFPNCVIEGVDFSEEAIKKAQKHYPDVSFRTGDVNKLEKNYDIIFSSNVLEHFDEPFTVIHNLLKNTKKHLIIMVPFKEYNRISEHLYTFDYQTFPLIIDSFELSYFREISSEYIEGTHWSGKQAVVIYTHKDYLEKENLTLHSYCATDDLVERYLTSSLSQVEETKRKLNEANESIQWYFNQLNQKEGKIQSLSDSLASNSDALKNLTNFLNDFLQKSDDKDKIINEKQQEIHNLYTQLWDKDSQINSVTNQLNNILHSRAWRLVRKYYNFRDSIVILSRKTAKFFKVMKDEGIKQALSQTVNFVKNRMANANAGINEQEITKVLNELLEMSRNNEIEGIAIINSAFEFDELYNQRTINLAKYLAEVGYGVLYVAWQWNEKEVLEKSYQKYLGKIYEVPLYDFLAVDYSRLSAFHKKHFINTFPAEQFYNIIPSLRQNGFNIIYDIMDEWEEFCKVGQAVWYKKAIEEATVLNSDIVFCVSKPLKEKFSHIRNDILVVGNGYNETLSGKKSISLKKQANDGKVHIGYFGHLTNSWFDWELIFEILKEDKIFVHLIGYGAPDEIINRLKSYSNVKYYGKVHPSQLHGNVSNWHVGIIPFKKSTLSEAVDPIKIYEYLFFGLPTISTGIPHIGKYPNVIHCEEPSEVIKNIYNMYDKVIASELDITQLDDFLANTTWEKRFEVFLDKSNEKNLFQELYINEH